MAKKTIIAPEASKQSQLVEFSAKEVDTHKMDKETSEHKRALLKADLRKEFVTLAEQVARSKICFRNYKYQGADQLYPRLIDASQRFVDKCFPYAKGGMLLVDEPKSDKQIVLAREKHDKLVSKGFRHLIIIEGETTYYDAMMELGDDLDELDNS